MRACVQRVSRASVTVAGEVTGQIESGLLILLGVADDDTPAEGTWLAEKILGLRIFNDDDGKMNRDVREHGGSVLVVSQFTLLGDCRKGRRPGFDRAAPPALAEQLYNEFVKHIAAQGLRVETGRFRAHMEVALVNDGPVTLLLDSRKLF